MNPTMEKLIMPVAVVASLTVATVVATLLLTPVTVISHPYPLPSSTSASSHGNSVKQGKRVMIAGSFNPPHCGHLNMIKYLSSIHERVYVVVGHNHLKKYMVSADDRVLMLRAMVNHAGLANVIVQQYSGLIWKHAVHLGASYLYRGIRSWEKDGRHERFLQLLNTLGPMLLACRPVPTVFLMAAPEFAHISSTMMRNRIDNGEPVADLIPGVPAELIARLFGTGGGSDEGADKLK